MRLKRAQHAPAFRRPKEGKSPFVLQILHNLNGNSGKLSEMGQANTATMKAARS